MPKSFKRGLLWLLAAIIVFTGLLIVRLKPEVPKPGVSAGDEEEALVVDTKVLAAERLVERLATTGTIEADEQVDLRSEIAGTVKRIHFDEGARVSAGSLLVKIDDEERVAQRDRALYRSELARQRETRQKDLLEQGLISQDEYDIALNQLNVFAAELRLAEAELAKTEIRAPFGGLVGFRSVSLGAAISPATRIARLQRIDPVKVEFSVPERYAARVRLGDEIEFRVKGTDERHSGTIYAIEPAVDRETRSLRARARSANPGGLLLPGAFADVEIVVSEVSDALTVPAIAVIPELGGKKVFVIEEGRAVPRVVETGIRTDTDVQIVRGLAAGDEVIVSGVQQLVTGLSVTPKTASSVTASSVEAAP